MAVCAQSCVSLAECLQNVIKSLPSFDHSAYAEIKQRLYGGIESDLLRLLGLAAEEREEQRKSEILLEMVGRAGDRLGWAE
jgi:hypothetical protein